MTHTIPILTRDSAVVLVIDLQEKLLPVIHRADDVMAAAGRLTAAAKILGLPILATEQYPAGLGRTSTSISSVWGDVRPVEKVRFSACVDELLDALSKLDRPQVIVAGIETHVCVQQSVMDLLRRGYLPVVCADAVSSRREIDRNVAIERMRDAGAIVATVESVVFEMVGQAGTDEFKQILRIVK